MLSMAVGDAWEGVDLAQGYPHYYRKMLADEALHQAFVDVLELLEGDSEVELGVCPALLDPDLSFLQRSDVVATITKIDETVWSVSWRPEHTEVMTTIDKLCHEHPADDGWWEEFRLLVLQSEVEVRGARLMVLLEAGPCHERSAGLVLNLNLFSSPVAPPDVSLIVRAVLTWGDMTKMITVSTNGRTCFEVPFLPEHAGRATGPIRLTLQCHFGRG